MDSARALCMLLGIPLHAGIIYSPGNWPIRSPDTSKVIEFIVLCIHSFRMPAFFMISGFFAAMMLTKRSPERWLLSRFQRLWIPLIFGMILINPFSVLATVMANMTLNGGGDLLQAFVQQVSRPSNLLRHLWFLPVLLWISVLAACIAILCSRSAGCRSVGKRIIHSVDSSFGLLILVAGLLLWKIVVLNLVKDSGLPLYAVFGWINIPNIIEYVPYFSFGCILFLNAEFRKKFLQPTFWAIALGIFFLSAYLINQALDDPYPYISNIIAILCAVFVSRLVLVAMNHFANKESKMVRSFVDLSFTIYIVHLPIINMMAVLFLHLNWPIGIEFVTIILVTLVVSYAIAMYINDHKWLRFVFNGVYPKKKHADISATPNLEVRR